METLVRCSGAPAKLAGHYDRFPASGRPPGLVLDIERRPGFAEGKPRPAGYPAFHRRLGARGEIALCRPDVEGELRVPSDDGPVVGSFVAGDSPNSAEAAIRAALSVALPRAGALVLHASAVAAGGGETSRAYVFSGHSGAGKTTISARVAGTGRARKIADDLLVIDADARAVVPPFVGAADLPHGEVVPVDSIQLLVQAPRHRRARLSTGEATRQLLRHVLAHVVEAATAARALSAVSALCERVPCFSLEFADAPEVADVLGIT
jgi:hypothetical protein